MLSLGENYRAFYAERVPWWLVIKAVGALGHGARLFDNTEMLRESWWRIKIDCGIGFEMRLWKQTFRKETETETDIESERKERDRKKNKRGEK